FSRGRAFTNLRQIGTFGNHLLQLATQMLPPGRSGAVAQWRSGGVFECWRGRIFPCFLGLLPSDVVRTIASHRITELG
ncbi:hypothetical protein ON021_07250, partial [Microcoleus sp. HI-ES]|nr:hypothetical protein [Microcoleus sp. HI-ES]